LLSRAQRADDEPLERLDHLYQCAATGTQDDAGAQPDHAQTEGLCADPFRFPTQAKIGEKIIARRRILGEEFILAR